MENVSERISPLPLSRMPLVGRTREMAAARAILLDTAAPLLTLTGPGGVGKTRLALAIAAEVAASFADGVAFVSLAAVREAELVLPTLARALGVPESGQAPLAARLAAALRQKEMLLLLDNFEHVVEAAPVVADLLAVCPAVHVLVTSRVPLHISTEQEFPVPPLPTPAAPDAVRPPSPLVLMQSEAVLLFLQRAKAVDPAFLLSETNAFAVAEICRRLDGLPLALELAAARLKVLSPDALLARLDRRLALLTGGDRNQPPRLRTLRDAIAWSYDLLDDGEQMLLRRLAIFFGGWTTPAAEAVVLPIAGPPRDIFDGIASLVDKSLLHRMPEGAGSEPRYTMLETVREFGLERLAETGEAAAVREAHAVWCLALAETAEPHLGGADQGMWLDRLEDDHHNLRAALGWCLQSGDADRGLRLATALLRFWDTRDFMSEGRGHLMAFLERSGAAASPRSRARANEAAGELATWEAEHALAARLAEHALAIWRETADQPGISRALWLLGINTLGLGDAMRASEMAEEGLSIARQTGDREVEALHLRLFGSIHAMRDEPAKAIPFQEAALAILRDLDVRAEICSVLGVLALAVGQVGDRERALALWKQVLPLARDVGEAWMIAFYLEGHAELALTVDRPDLAARWLGAADAWRVKRGAPVLGINPSTSRAFATATARLGEDAFAAALAAGQALSLDEAVDEVHISLAAAPVLPVSPVSPVPTWAASRGLTPREYEVLQLLARRWSDREIADALFVSPRTVHGHVAGIFAKIGVENRRAADRVAAEHGLG